MLISKRWSIRLIGWHGQLFYWNICRFNSGDPYCEWRVGPVSVRRWGYMGKDKQ